MNQSFADIKTELKELGAVFETNNSGYIPVESPLEKTHILEYTITDTTPPLRRVKQNVVRNVVYRNILSLKHGEYLFKKVCTKYHDPKIDFHLIPLYITNVEVSLNPFDLYIRGDIVNNFANFSKEGEEGRCITWKWRSCPSSESAYDWQKVEGSNLLNGDWYHNMVENETEQQNKMFSYLHQAYQNNLHSGYGVDMRASWSTGGVLDWIKNMVSVFTTGKVHSTHGYDLALTYQWKGQAQTVNRHVRSVVNLPVKGDIKYTL